jgi:hypothetical protein
LREKLDNGKVAEFLIQIKFKVGKKILPQAQKYSEGSAKESGSEVH